MNKNLKNKQGMSLVALVISIIIALILISISIFGVKNSIDNASITAYAQDMYSIKEAAQNYYVENDSFPVIDGTDAISQEDVISIAGADIQTELVANGDYVDNPTNPTLAGAYYQIDLSKINVSKSLKGTRTSGDNKDVYVVAYPSMNIYYLKGVKLKKHTYYSLSKDLINMTKLDLDKTNDTSVSTLESNAGMSVKRQNKKWTNKLGITVQTNIVAGEQIYLSIAGGTLKEITPIGAATSFPVGENTFTMENLTDIFNGKEGIKIAGLTLADDIGLENLEQKNKYIEIVKYKAGAEIGRIKINLSNYEKEIPTRTTVPVLESKESTNWVSFKVADLKSGIKEVRYEYLTKYNSNGQIQNYYNGITELDDTYLRTRGKKATLSEQGYIQMKLPKDIEGIQILVLDRAGNWFNMTQPIYDSTRTVGGSMYVGIVPKNIGETIATFKAIINNSLGVNTVKTYLSLDGVTFGNEKIYTPNTTDQIKIIDVDDYTNIENKNGDFYIKVVATDSSNKTETVIMSLKEMKENIEANTVKFGINKPILAAGMTPIKWDDGGNVVTTTESDFDWYDYENKKWANAQTADGSMWVWIPRYEYDIPDANEHTSTAGTINVNFIAGVNTVTTAGYILHPAFTFGTEELTGIWIAKFEASGATNTVTLKPGVVSLRSLSIDAMFTACRNMETTNGTQYGWGTSGTGIDTHLMKNIEWGAAGYLSNSIYGKNSEIWINPNTSFLTGQAGTVVNSSTTNTTYAYNNLTYGINASTTGNLYGIYDMSGGSWEYTAAYINNGNASLAANGLSLINAETKYKDLYIVTTDDQVQNYQNSLIKKGDSIYETSSSGIGSTAWYTDASYTPYTSAPFFLRGGYNVDNINSGVFSFGSSYGGFGSGHFGFRPVIAVKNTL